VELNTLIQPVIDISAKAAQGILEIYNTRFNVEVKDDKTPLTEADMAAHDAIVAGLKKLTPEWPILSEESATIPYSTRQKWHTYWLVDPLDGTREFIKRNGEFTVNIALIRDELPVLGVIYVPVSGVVYYASKGMGAFRQSPGNAALPIHVKAARDQTLVIAGSRSHRDNSLDKFLDSIGDHEFISMGSSLKSCLVAEGSADIYPRLGPTSEWDTAAAQCIVEEAGGRITTMDMSQLRYNTKESLLNPNFLVFGDASVDWSKLF